MAKKKNNQKCIIGKMNQGMSNAEAVKACAPRQSNLVANGEMTDDEVVKYINPQVAN